MRIARAKCTGFRWCEKTGWSDVGAEGAEVGSLLPVHKRSAAGDPSGSRRQAFFAAKRY